MHEQRKITSPSRLLRSDGELARVGWARNPLFDCNLEQARFYRLRPLQRFRVKCWDYYGVTYPGGFFSATIAHLGYAGQVFAYHIDFDNGTYHEDTITIPFGRGVHLPRNSTDGESFYAGRRARLRFHADGEGRRLEVGWADFGGVPLTADIRFALPADHESTVVVIPIGLRRFYYNRKVNCMPAAGSLRIGDRTIALSTEALGNLDWGRGAGAYDSFWVWPAHRDSSAMAGGSD